MLPSLSKHFIKAMKYTVRRRGPTQEELAAALHNLTGDARRAKSIDMHEVRSPLVWDRRYTAELAKALMSSN